MTTHTTTDRLIPAARVRDLAGGVSDVTIYRWLQADHPPIPHPVRIIGGRRYWSEQAVRDALGLTDDRGVAA